MRKSQIVLFLLAFLIWAFLTWPLDFQHFIVGVFICGLVAFLTGDLFIKKPHKLRQFSRYFWFFYYVPLFVWECIRANLDVAYRVIHPDLPINPGIVKVKTKLKSDTALTFLANSITLTPGTMSVDIDEENGFLYIHWIDVREKDIHKATEMIVKKFEDVLARIFE